MRGADYSIPHQLSLIYDSSPHARGRLDRYETNTTRQRFIPSCEGQTRPTGRLGFFRLIHPLMRGADGLRTSSRSLTSDSSPHAKGRLHYFRLYFVNIRFIPSCEGQTLSVYAAFSRLKHFVVQFTQMPFSSHRMLSPLHLIC